MGFIISGGGPWLGGMCQMQGGKEVTEAAEGDTGIRLQCKVRREITNVNEILQNINDPRELYFNTALAFLPSIIVLSCGHVFHRECLDNYLDRIFGKKKVVGVSIARTTTEIMNLIGTLPENDSRRLCPAQECNIPITANDIRKLRRE
jgi:hypothetical protein